MIIKSIELSKFRNYDFLNVDFDEHINILYGDNAQGKTNVLEAIYYTGTTKSHRSSKDRDMIKIGENESHIRMIVERKQVSHRIDMHLKKNKTKGIAMDGITIKRSSDLIGLVNIVFFSPEDLSIIKNGPGERRRFLDMELCQLDKVYLHNLSKYNKIIVQRNNLLKQLADKKELLETLEVWDLQLLEYGSKIIRRRGLFIKQLNDIIGNIHHKLSGGKEILEVSYEPNVLEDEFEAKLKKSRERDLYLKTTNHGPHRDDISFHVGEIDIRKYGSQGQQRTSALSLKLSEIEMVQKVIGESPILLLDDVLSELDRNRQNHLLDSISDTQTIITCTGLEEFVQKRMPVNRIYEVVQGIVTSRHFDL